MAFSSDFFTMGSNKAYGVNVDGLWEWWDGFYFWEMVSIGDSIIDNGLSLNSNIEMIFSHALPPHVHLGRDH